VLLQVSRGLSRIPLKHYCVYTEPGLTSRPLPQCAGPTTGSCRAGPRMQPNFSGVIFRRGRIEPTSPRLRTPADRRVLVPSPILV
jgi:hypothetical protein